ncbi:hypothetical protein PAPYR_3722 [Paratrimastix pyriformis]|uniref:Rho-GAP domain-containing protein n=1 Tax=Paratrimastix pyriformis TaxID=342808 RepID=A0ABQ8UNG6_9EUKA|nr:hypothetical protein PAPYR_3722 [Paratrimastix pyriformis]
MKGEKLFFGQSLAAILSRPENNPLPQVLVASFRVILESGFISDDLFRNTSVPGLPNLRAEIDRDGAVHFRSRIDEEFLAIAVVKAFLHDLPEPLIPFARYWDFLAVASLSEERHQVQDLWTLVQALPPQNYQILLFLVRQINEIARRSANGNALRKSGARSLASDILRPPRTACDLTPISERDAAARVFEEIFGAPDRYFPELGTTIEPMPVGPLAPGAAKTDSATPAESPMFSPPPRPPSPLPFTPPQAARSPGIVEAHESPPPPNSSCLSVATTLPAAATPLSMAPYRDCPASTSALSPYQPPSYYFPTQPPPNTPCNMDDCCSPTPLRPWLAENAEPEPVVQVVPTTGATTLGDSRSSTSTTPGPLKDVGLPQQPEVVSGSAGRQCCHHCLIM